MRRSPPPVLDQKKSRSTTVFIIALLALLSSCDPSGKENLVRDVPIEPGIFRGEPATGIIQNHPKALGIADSILIVIDEFEEPLINFYSLRTLAYLGGYGRFGNGPGEFLNPEYYGQSFYENDSLCFLIVDSKKNALVKLNLKRILHNGHSNTSWSVRLPSDLFNGFSSLFLTEDSTVIGNYRSSLRYYRTGRFFSYNIATGKIKWSDYYPHLDVTIRNNQKPYYYYSFGSFNPDRVILASAMSLFKRVDFIDTKFKILNSTIFATDSGDIPNPEDVGSPRLTQYFNASFAGKYSYYALCINGTLSDYVNDVGKMQLYLFSWTGDLKKVLNLDRMYLGLFAVDETLQTLYVINFGHNREREPILKYDLADANIAVINE